MIAVDPPRCLLFSLEVTSSRTVVLFCGTVPNSKERSPPRGIAISLDMSFISSAFTENITNAVHTIRIIVAGLEKFIFIFRLFFILFHIKNLLIIAVPLFKCPDKMPLLIYIRGIQ
jgi:hypothetical protein